MMRPTYLSCGQIREEFCAFLGMMSARKITSYLEIGSWQGTSFYNVMMNVVDAPGLGIMVDNDPGQRAARELMASWVRAMSHRVEVFEANSHDASIIERIRRLGPYDLVFIDASHEHDDVRADWENYGPMGAVVALHDLALEGPAKVWADIPGRKLEIRELGYGPASGGGNIGVVIQRDA